MKKWLLMFGFVGCAALYSCEYETTGDEGFTQSEGTEEVQPEEGMETEEQNGTQEADTTAGIEDGGYELDTEEDVM